jgi:hypothetical protein
VRHTAAVARSNLSLSLSSPIARERKISWRLVCSREAGVLIPCARSVAARFAAHGSKSGLGGKFVPDFMFPRALPSLGADR